MNAIKHIIAVIAVYIRNLINAQHNAERVKFLQDAVNVKRERLVRENKRYTRWRGRAERAERRVRQLEDMTQARDSQLERLERRCAQLFSQRDIFGKEKGRLEARVNGLLQYITALEVDRVELAKKASKGRYDSWVNDEFERNTSDYQARIDELEDELQEKDEKIGELECELDDMRWAEDDRDTFLSALREIKATIDDLDI